MDTRINFTKPVLDKLPLPEAGQRVVYHDAGGPSSVRGLQLRVTANGVKTFSVFQRVKGGKPERVTLGHYPAMSIETARTKALEELAKFAIGKSPKEEKQEKREQALTLAEALEQYVEKKTRKGSGLHLKERTKADYRAMLKPGKAKPDGTQGPDGELFTLADKPIHAITAADIRRVHEKNEERSVRRAAYAVVVLRAVLNWKTIIVPNDPFGKDTKGQNHIDLPTYDGKPKPIRKPYRGLWWRAACNAGSAEVGGSKLAGDYYCFRLLTGTRGVEVLGDGYGNEPIRVKDVDLVDARIALKDTKNRKGHVLLLSRQALEIAKRNAEGKSPDAPLFPVGDPRKTLKAINKAAGLGEDAVQGHDLRDTFASIAERLVSAYTLKALMNHKIQRSDTTGTSYIEVEEEEMRAGWQVVADHLDAQAAAVKADNVVAISSEVAA